MELLSRQVWVERWSTGELQHKHDTRFLKSNLIKWKFYPPSFLQVDGRFTTSVVPVEKVERKLTVDSLELEPLFDEVVVF